MKIKWKVQPSPTGPYRSFHTRGWPKAEYENGTPAAMITSESKYVPENARTGNHLELTVYIADHSAEHSFNWRRLKKKCTTLTEAKDLAVKALEANKHFMPNHKYGIGGNHA